MPTKSQLDLQGIYFIKTQSVPLNIHKPVCSKTNIRKAVESTPRM